jgi:hypothetical protein
LTKIIEDRQCSANLPKRLSISLCSNFAHYLAFHQTNHCFVTLEYDISPLVKKKKKKKKKLPIWKLRYHL